MTNTKFRKRALLSSVAMLLVALVALGSATFAWFVDDPDADAKGISVQANTALGLVAMTTTDTNWGHHPLLYKNITGDSILVPATTNNDGETFWTAQAAAASASGIKTGDTTSKWSSVNISTGEKSTGGVYHEVVTLKTTGGKAANVILDDFVMTTSNNAMAGAVVVLVKCGTNKYYFQKEAGSLAQWTTLSASTQTAAANGTAKSTLAANTTKVGGMNKALGSVSASGTLAVDVYVFLDGANAAVYTDAASAAQLVSSIELYFHATAA